MYLLKIVFCQVLALSDDARQLISPPIVPCAQLLQFFLGDADGTYSIFITVEKSAPYERTNVAVEELDCRSAAWPSRLHRWHFGVTDKASDQCDQVE